MTACQPIAPAHLDTCTTGAARALPPTPRPTPPTHPCPRPPPGPQVKCGDPEVDALVEAKVTEFVAFIERSAQRPGDVAQLRLGFYERRRRQAGWFGIGADERLYWEQWCGGRGAGQGGAGQSGAGRRGRGDEAVKGSNRWVHLPSRPSTATGAAAGRQRTASSIVTLATPLPPHRTTPPHPTAPLPRPRPRTSLGWHTLQVPQPVHRAARPLHAGPHIAGVH